MSYQPYSITEGIQTVLPVDTIALYLTGVSGAAIAVGDTISGDTSGASATVAAIDNTGDTTKTIYLKTVTGTFQAGENVSSGTGGALVAASGTITVVDYSKFNPEAATGAITYGVPVGAVKATGSITYGVPIALAAASQTITYGNPTEGVKASATITYGAPAEGDHIIVNGYSMTYVSSEPATGEFTDIASLTALVNGRAEISATADATTITIVADAYGVAGNAFTLSVGAGNAGTMAVSGANFTGGTECDTITVDGTQFSCVTSAPGATEFTNITELTALIQALPNVNATDDATTITVVAATKGAAGNSIALSLGGSNAGTMALTGATLAGGADGDTVVVNGTTLTCIDAAPGAAQFSSIIELEALVEALSGIDSSQNGTVVSIVAAAGGTAGNAITLAVGGANAGTMSVSGATLTGGINGDTVVVNGNTFTCVTYTAGASQFSNIAELEALTEAVSDLNSSQNGTVVSLTCATPGTAGNSMTLAVGGSNAGTMSVSGATLSGGHAYGTVTVAGQVLTAGTDFTAETSNDVTATNLAAAIDALAEVSATALAAVVTVTAIAEGDQGNTIGLVRSISGSCNVSGATLASGADETDATVGSIDTSAPAQIISCRGCAKVELNCFDAADDVWISLTSTEPAANMDNGFEKITHGAGWRVIDGAPNVKIVSASTKFPKVMYRIYN